MKIAIGCDEAAYDLKEQILTHLSEQNQISVQVKDFGTDASTPIDYPDVALQVAEAILHGEFERGILLCGTGIGMAIAANKVHGIRAATCHDVYSTERAQKSNNAQILTLGARVIGPELEKAIVSVWLAAEFAGGGSARKVEKIGQIEHKYGGIA